MNNPVAWDDPRGSAYGHLSPATARDGAMEAHPSADRAGALSLLQDARAHEEGGAFSCLLPSLQLRRWDCTRNSQSTFSDVAGTVVASWWWRTSVGVFVNRSDRWSNDDMWWPVEACHTADGSSRRHFPFKAVLRIACGTVLASLSYRVLF
jgi:hypothetical protein